MAFDNLHKDLKNDQLHKPRDFSTADVNTSPYKDAASVYVWQNEIWHPPVKKVVDVTLAPPSNAQGDRYYTKDLTGTTPHADWGSNVKAENIAHRGLGGTVPTWFKEPLVRGDRFDNYNDDTEYRWDGTTSQKHTGGVAAWTEVTGPAQALAVNQRYLGNLTGKITYTLPATCAIGDEIEIIGNTRTTQLWEITQPNVLDQISVNDDSTTLGLVGKLYTDADSGNYSAIKLVCKTGGSTGGHWVAQHSMGQLLMQ